MPNVNAGPDLIPGHDPNGPNGLSGVITATGSQAFFYPAAVRRRPPTIITGAGCGATTLKQSAGRSGRWKISVAEAEGWTD
jgi:hypothetical protein